MKKSHMLIMLLCCLVPIAGLAAVFLFKVPVNSVVYGAMFLICPIAMVFMVISMLKDHNADNSKANSPSIHSETIDIVAKDQ